jgi:DNA-binding transcriptional ArsR family regulator
MSDNAPHVLDYSLDESIDADSPARLKALGNPLRALILDLVLERAMTVSEVAERVGKPRGSVAHHVDVLVNAGLLKVTATRKVRSIDERFYGRTARTIMFPDSVMDGDLPFFADARSEADMTAGADCGGGFTLRHARIPAHLANEFTDRVMALALEFTRLPRSGNREYAFIVGVFPTHRRVAPKAEQ